MRRIIGLIMALAIALSITLIGGFSVSAESDMSASDECIKILKIYEGFSSKPYYDYGQWTIGYGTRCPSDKVEYYKIHGISEADAEKLLREFIESYNKAVNGFADKYELTFTQSQFDALVLFSFNCGSGWIYSPGQNFHQTIAKGDKADPKDVLYWFGSWSNAGGKPLSPLINRRLCEANMYLNGAYTTAVPENYNYVIYDAMGGSVLSRVHAYDTAADVATPTYVGYEFAGWFTDKKGGTQITALDESTDGLSLYARWEGDGPTGSEGSNEITPVGITVTSNYVNLRKGPGTNYATVGQANTGDKLTIFQIATGSGLTWGGFDGGWICLTYTNYEQVKDGPVEEPTEPEPTEPEPTEPEPTEPEPTEPEPTEPEPTEPEPTEPPKTETVTGKVKANGGLNIRSGPGTGYKSVGMLNNGDRVEILEQKSVGSMVWGKISKGWISMSYVVLDKQEEPKPEDPKPEDPKPEDPKPEEPGNEADAVTGYVKANGGLNIRGGAGTTYPIVGTYNDGDKVTVLQKQTVGSVTWGKTDKGWISLNYFTTEAPANGGSSGNTQTSAVKGTVKVDDMLRIRSGPGTSYAISGYYKNGDKVTIMEEKTVNSTTWGKTDKGWISLDYVTLEESEGGKEDPGNDTNTRTVTASCLNVRSAAGTGNKVVAYLYAGTKVQILEEKTVDGVLWGKIASGWICLEYTK